jgi:hypothetical protein
MTRVRAAFLALVACSVVLASCGGSGYQYVKNGDLDLYFKVPEDWQLFDEKDLYASPAVDLQPLERERALARTWFRGFDASPQPAVENVLASSPPVPTGFVRIQALTDEEREVIDLSTLRGLYLRDDPVITQREDPHGPVEVLSEEDVKLDGGYHGVRMLVAYDSPDGSIGIVEQMAVLDASNRLLYLFVVGCSERCYFENRDTIDEIAGSWTIEED